MTRSKLLQQKSRRAFIAIAGVFMLSCVGCGSKIGVTSGKVVFEDGSPVQSGSIEFRRQDDKSRYASRIFSQGRFIPTDLDGKIGLPPGKYDAVVVQIVLTEDLAKQAHSHGQTVSRHHADYHTSGLTVEIAPEDTEPIKLVVEAESEDASGE